MGVTNARMNHYKGHTQVDEKVKYNFNKLLVDYTVLETSLFKEILLLSQLQREVSAVFTHRKNVRVSNKIQNTIMF